AVAENCMVSRRDIFMTHLPYRPAFPSGISGATGKRSAIRATGYGKFSMNLRLRNAFAREQKVEIATLVGLPDMGGVHRPITAGVARRRRTPSASTAGEFLLGDVQMDMPRIGIDLDLVAGAHQSERSAHIALRSYVQNAGAIAGAAHT